MNLITTPYVNGYYYRAEYKPWLFPFIWLPCYGYQHCCSAKTAEKICNLHSSGVKFNPGEIDFVIEGLDSNH